MKAIGLVILLAISISGLAQHRNFKERPKVIERLDSISEVELKICSCADSCVDFIENQYTRVDHYLNQYDDGFITKDELYDLILGEFELNRIYFKR